MAHYFTFHDTPRMGDVWETKIEIDVLIHTRPMLLVQRDRYARKYGSSYSEFEMQSQVYRGLRDYGYETFPALSERLFIALDQLIYDALGDLDLAYGARQNHPPSVKKYAARERTLLAEALDSPELIARFIEGPLTQMSELDPVARLQEVYALRGARLGELIPFSERAPDLLAEAFGRKLVKNNPPIDPRYLEDGELALRDVPKITQGEVYELHKELFHEVITSLIRRLENHPGFLDQILEKWVVPRLDARFEELGDHIDEFLSQHKITISRNEFLSRTSANKEWLEMAKEFGAPVPKIEME